MQTAVDTTHHLIVTHEVTNVGHDRAQLSPMAKQAKATLEVDKLDVVADRGYFSSEEILACDQAGITVTLPKPQTSNNRLKGRFVKQDFVYLPQQVEHWLLTTLREKLIKIGAKVVRHGRYITFQMAETAIPRILFVEILRLIDGLRPATLPP